MASVDYLETVHPLDYPIFQALVSGQFAKRRRLVDISETAAAENSQEDPSVGTLEVLQHSSEESDSGQSSAQLSTRSVLTDAEKITIFSSDSGMSQADESLHTLKHSDSMPEKFSLLEPSEGCSSQNSGGNKSGDVIECKPSTSQQTEKYHGVQRTPASLCTAISDLRTKKHPRHEKKAVSFVGYRRLFHPRGAVCGTFHHNSADQGLSSYRGSQCTSIAMTAIMASKSLPVHTWISSDIDAIIRSGDKLHGQLISEMDKKSDDTTISLHEVQSGGENIYTIAAPNPNVNNWFSDSSVALQMCLRKSLQYTGKVGSHSALSKMNKTGDISLEDALAHVFDYGYDGALIIVGDTTGAVMKDFRGNVRFFDSQSNNKLGQSIRNGTAVLLKFPSLHHFVYYMKKREKNPLCPFEMLGVSFNVLGRYVMGVKSRK